MMFDGNTTVKLYKNIQLEPNNTILFDSIDKQNNYFENRDFLLFEKCRFIKTQSNRIAVNGYYNDLLTYNYLSFTNDYFKRNKTFYAFITNIEYINDTTSYIYFNIDVLQTFMFDFTLNECFVEREHVVENDKINNFITEEIQVSDLKIADTQFIDDLLGDLAIVIGVSDCESGDLGGIYNGMYSGLKFWACPSKKHNLATDFINSYSKNGKSDAICLMYMTYCNLIGLSSDSDGTFLTQGTSRNLKDNYTIPIIDNFSGYKPKNLKCFSYPYMMIRLIDDNGNNVILKPELLNNINELKLEVNTSISGAPSVIVTPKNYNGQNLAYNDEIELSNFPLCSWNNDTFANWYAQNSHTYNNNSALASQSLKLANENRDSKAIYDAINLIPTAMNVFQWGKDLDKLGSGIVNGIYNYDYSTRNSQFEYDKTISQLTSSLEDMKVLPNNAKGSISSNAINLIRGTHTVRVEILQAKYSDITRIDDYFSRYGYSVNKFEIPNLKSRPYWNYIRTNSCKLTTNIPYEYRNIIMELFNGGITFWHTSMINNYQLNNK